jgi:hypothetical protein
MKIRNLIQKVKSLFEIIECGDSMNYLGKKYLISPNVDCNIGDKVIIHPVIGKSMATKSYPAKINTKLIRGKDGKAEGFIWVLVVEGIEDNKNWRGAWMTDYLFDRLEFVSRNYKDKK